MSAINRVKLSKLKEELRRLNFTILYAGLAQVVECLGEQGVCQRFESAIWRIIVNVNARRGRPQQQFNTN